MYLPGVKANRYDRRLLSNLLCGLGAKIYDENQSCISLIVSKPDLLQQRHTQYERDACLHTKKFNYMTRRDP